MFHAHRPAYAQAFAGPFRPAPPGTVVEVKPLMGMGSAFPGSAGPFVSKDVQYTNRSASAFGIDTATMGQQVVTPQLVQPKAPAVAVAPQAPPQPVSQPPAQTQAQSSTLKTVMTIGGWVGSIAGAYHGYKRTESIGWAIGWSMLGGAFWPLALPIMAAQGFGKPLPKVATANRRKAKRNARRLSIKTIAEAMAHDHIKDPLVGKTVKASDVDMFEDYILELALQENGYAKTPANVEKLRLELRKSLARAERSYR